MTDRFDEYRGNLGDSDDPSNIQDEQVHQLLNYEFDEKRKTADTKRSKMSKEEYHKLRALCKRDLFYLSYAILGNKRLSPDLHGHLCEYLRLTQHDRFHTYLLPRGHFKSTIITIAHTIQIVLPYTAEDKEYDEDQSDIPWPNSLGTDARVLIGHETAESAARFLFAITNHFLSNPLLLTLFPDATPTKRQHKINKWELELPRSDEARGNPEPTIDTLGVGAKSQGRHYNYIKLDDIFGDKARDSRTEAENTIQWFDNIQSFFSLFAKDHLDLIGTRYSTDDVYAHAIKEYGSSLKKYIRKVQEVNPDTGKKFYIFHEEFDDASTAIIKRNKKVWAAQYNNDPYAGEGGFKTDWKKFFYFTHTINKIVALESDNVRRFLNVRDLDVVILLDPGVGKSGGLVVSGMDYIGNVYTLEAIKLEHSTPEITDLIFRLVQRWRPRTVAVESDIFASTFQYWWGDIMPKKGISFHITPVHTKKQSKDFRIAGLTNYAEHGKLYINEQQIELNLEWDTWGRSKDIHILDALAYGPEIWRPGYRPGERELVESNAGGQEPSVDAETGYSQINYAAGEY